jgi:restriction system protein
MIEEGLPNDWRDLQNKTAQILAESGLEAQTDYEISLARGTVSVDVLARDASATPPAMYIWECKYWKTSVSKNVVHGFRTVLVDSGAHRGFLISSGGFQSGAYEAAEYSNVELVNWPEFQGLFSERWFHMFMAPTLLEEGNALHEYTEPINSRIARKADALPFDRQEQFRSLQERYAIPSFVLLRLWFDFFTHKPKVPVLPLRTSLGPRAPIDLPAEILDAVSLRPLMDVVTRFYREATAEFDQVFGGRA